MITLKEHLIKKHIKNTDNGEAADPKPWIDICKDFSLSGAWRWCQIAKGPEDFLPDFINDARKFKIDEWPVRGRFLEQYKAGYKLAFDLIDKKPKSQIIADYKPYMSSDPYWYQSFTYRRDPTKLSFIIEALLNIGYSLYKDEKRNLWYGGDIQTNDFEHNV